MFYKQGWAAAHGGEGAASTSSHLLYNYKTCLFSSLNLITHRNLALLLTV